MDCIFLENKKYIHTGQKMKKPKACRKELYKKVKGDLTVFIYENSWGEEEMIYEGMVNPVNRHKAITERINGIKRFSE